MLTAAALIYADVVLKLGHAGIGVYLGLGFGLVLSALATGLAVKRHLVRMQSVENIASDVLEDARTRRLARQLHSQGFSPQETSTSMRQQTRAERVLKAHKSKEQTPDG